MDISTDDHDIFTQIFGFGGMPDWETNFDVHLEDNSRNSRESFLEGVDEDTLGGYS